jgi:hypothetical protein
MGDDSRCNRGHPRSTERDAILRKHRSSDVNIRVGRAPSQNGGKGGPLLSLSDFLIHI